MGMIMVEDVVGYFVGQEFVCCRCTTREEVKSVRENDLIILDDVERGDALYFCDRCQEAIG